MAGVISTDPMLSVSNNPCLNSTATHGNSTPIALDRSLAETWKVVVGTLNFLLVLPFVLFEFRVFPIGSTFAILLGALLMVLCRVVTEEEVYAVIGRQDNLTTILLLAAVMLLAQYVEREQLLANLLRRLLHPDYTFVNYLWRVCLMSFLLAALFTSDAACAILTPILLGVWDVQERPRSELETLLLGVATSSNLGSVLTVFGSPHMAVIASRTSTGSTYVGSRLDPRTCLIYLALPATVACCLNAIFLTLHHRLRTRKIQNSQLISELSQNEQELAGLTGDGGNDGRGQKIATPLNNPTSNGHVKMDVAEGDQMGIFNISSTCSPSPSLVGRVPLETIPEDEELQIVHCTPIRSSQQDDAGFEMMTRIQVSDPSVDNHFSYDSCNINGNCTPKQHSQMATYDNLSSPYLCEDSCGSGDGGGGRDSDDDDDGLETSSSAALKRCSPSLEINRLDDDDYRLNAAFSRDPTSASTDYHVQRDFLNNLAEHNSFDSRRIDTSVEFRGFKVSQKFRIYRCTSAISAVDFLPSESGLQSTNRNCGGVGGTSGSQILLAPSGSVVFQIVLCGAILLTVALLLASTDGAQFDIGLIPIGAFLLILIADTAINRQAPSYALRRVDWSVLFTLMAFFVWMYGLTSTRATRSLWKAMGLADDSTTSLSSISSPRSVCVFALFVLLGSNVFGSLPITLVILDQLEPCRDQLRLVLLLAWCVALAGNLTMFGSVANLVVVQKGVQTLKYRLSFGAHFAYGLPTTIFIASIGIGIIVGLIEII